MKKFIVVFDTGYGEESYTIEARDMRALFTKLQVPESHEPWPITKIVDLEYVIESKPKDKAAERVAHYD